MLQGLQSPGGWGGAGGNGSPCIVVIVSNISQVLGGWPLLRASYVLTCFRSQTPQVCDILIYSSGMLYLLSCADPWRAPVLRTVATFPFPTFVLGLSPVI